LARRYPVEQQKRLLAELRGRAPDHLYARRWVYVREPVVLGGVG